MSLHEAHLKSAEMKEKISKGEDPRLKIQAGKKSEREAETVKGLVEEYLNKHAKVKKRSWEEDQRMLEKDVLPAWGNRKAKDITRRDIIALLDQIVDRGAPIAANRTLGVIRRMFSFGVSRGLLQASPCIEIEPPGKEKSRDRALKEDEIKIFWFGLDNAKMDPKTKLALKLILTTMQRKGEVVNAEWSEFDLKKNWWTIPADKSKNKLAHQVYLSSLALGLIDDIRKLSGDSKWLFPSPLSNDKPITTRSISSALLNNQTEPRGNAPIDKKRQDSFGLESFTPHDLRRTGASLLAGSGVPRLTIGKVLNHADSGVTAVYDRHSYDKEKQVAMESWGRKLETIITGNIEQAKVIPMLKK